MSMSNIYQVGRDPSCNIYIYDPSNVVSRSHATIRVDGRKRFITDHSTNGTYRNGIRLAPDIEYPFSKDDEILLGGVYRLDWSAVPKRKGLMGSALIYPLILLLAAALVLAAIYLIPKYRTESSTVPDQETRDSVVTGSSSVAADSLVVLEDLKAKPKKTAPKKGVDRKTDQTKGPSTSVSKKNVRDYTDDDDRRDVDAI